MQTSVFFDGGNDRSGLVPSPDLAGTVAGSEPVNSLVDGSIRATLRGRWLRRGSRLFFASAAITGAAVVGLSGPLDALEPDHNTPGGSSFGGTSTDSDNIADGAADDRYPTDSSNSRTSSSAADTSIADEGSNDDRDDSLDAFGGTGEPVANTYNGEDIDPTGYEGNSYQDLDSAGPKPADEKWSVEDQADPLLAGEPPDGQTGDSGSVARTVDRTLREIVEAGGSSGDPVHDLARAHDGEKQGLDEKLFSGELDADGYINEMDALADAQGVQQSLLDRAVVRDLAGEPHYNREAVADANHALTLTELPNAERDRQALIESGLFVTPNGDVYDTPEAATAATQAAAEANGGLHPDAGGVLHESAGEALAATDYLNAKRLVEIGPENVATGEMTGFFVAPIGIAEDLDFARQQAADGHPGIATAAVIGSVLPGKVSKILPSGRSKVVPTPTDAADDIQHKLDLDLPEESKTSWIGTLPGAVATGASAGAAFVAGTQFAGSGTEPTYSPREPSGIPVKDTITDFSGGNYDAFGIEYDSNSESQAADLMATSQSMKANYSVGIDDAQGDTSGPMNGVVAGVYRNSYGTGIIGTPDHDELSISERPMRRYRATINGKSYELNEDDLDQLIMIGNGGADLMFGSDQSEIFIGSHDSDTILPGGGSDFAAGGKETDRILIKDSTDPSPNIFVGGPGHDVIRGGPGADKLLGNSGGDWIFAGAGPDVVSGGSGPDLIYGNRGNDVLIGQEDNDYIDGGPGDDVVHGGPGDDSAIGGTGDDAIDPGPGNDTAITGPGNDVVANFDDDADKVYAEETDQVALSAGDERILVNIELPDPSTSAFRYDPTTDVGAQAESDIPTLASTPAGKALLASIQDSGHKVYIEPGMTRHRYGAYAYTKPTLLGRLFTSDESVVQRPDGEPGETLDSVVGLYAEPSLGPNPSQLPITHFAHELIHVDDNANGTTAPGNSVELSADGTARVDRATGYPVVSPNNELRTTGLPYDPEGSYGETTLSPDHLEVNPSEYSENLIREQLGLPQTQNYQTSLPADFSVGNILFGSETEYAGIPSERHRLSWFDDQQAAMQQDFHRSLSSADTPTKAAALEGFEQQQELDRETYLNTSKRLTEAFDSLAFSRQDTTDQVADLELFHTQQWQDLNSSSLQADELEEAQSTLAANQQAESAALAAAITLDFSATGQGEVLHRKANEFAEKITD